VLLGLDGIIYALIPRWYRREQELGATNGDCSTRRLGQFASFAVFVLLSTFWIGYLVYLG
jgi:hypothetical protein